MGGTGVLALGRLTGLPCTAVCLARAAWTELRSNMEQQKQEHTKAICTKTAKWQREGDSISSASLLGQQVLNMSNVKVANLKTGHLSTPVSVNPTSGIIIPRLDRWKYWFPLGQGDWKLQWPPVTRWHVASPHVGSLRCAVLRGRKKQTSRKKQLEKTD